MEARIDGRRMEGPPAANRVPALTLAAGEIA